MDDKFSNELKDAGVESKAPDTVTEEIKTKTSEIAMQHVVVTLADGRRGVFIGPELIKEVEMKLGLVPKLVSVDFDPPKAVTIPVPRELPPVEEAPSANQKIDDKPAAGLE